MIPWTVACHAPQSMRFPRQEYWSGLPFPSPGDLPDPGTEPTSPGIFFTTPEAMKLSLVPWKKSYDQPRQHIKKAEILPTKVRLVKAMVFPVVMYICWTVKKAGP